MKLIPVHNILYFAVVCIRFILVPVVSVVVVGLVIVRLLVFVYSIVCRFLTFFINWIINRTSFLLLPI